MTAIDDFWIQKIRARVVVDEQGCWLWQGPIDHGGYGRIGGKSQMAGHSQMVHRAAYVATYGDIPDGLVLDHLCRIRHCCNPQHLEAVTQQVNVDRANTYRMTTTCRAGLHDITLPGALAPVGDKRTCRECRRISARRYWKNR